MFDKLIKTTSKKFKKLLKIIPYSLLALFFLVFSFSLGNAYAQEELEWRNPYEWGFPYPHEYDCDEEAEYEFDPTRPYPGSPCDPLLLKSWPEHDYTSFSCGKSLSPQGLTVLPGPIDVNTLPTMPTNLSDVTPNQVYRCADDPSQACMIKSHQYDIRVDLRRSRMPVLGNSEVSLVDDKDLDDMIKSNQYLFWYLAGTVNSSEHVELDHTNREDSDRIINYSGPLQKLLPFDIVYDIRRDEILKGPIKEDFHNYILNLSDVIGDIEPPGPTPSPPPPPPEPEPPDGPPGPPPGPLPPIPPGTCPTTSNNSYSKVSISPLNDHPKAQHGDLNLPLRGYSNVTAQLGLTHYGGDTDPDAPQIAGMFSDNRLPFFTAAYQVFDRTNINTVG
jgi:hypothetical protein